MRRARPAARGGGIGVPRDQGPPLRLAPPRAGGDHPDAVPFPGVTDLVFAHGRFEVSEGVRMAMRDNRCRVTVAPSPSGVDGDVITPVARDMVSLQAVYVADTAWRSGRDLYRRPIADAAGTLEGCRWDAGGAVIERVWRRRSC